MASSKRLTNHPLFQIIRRKIAASEKLNGLPNSIDPISRYFPPTVDGQHIDAFVLDRSFNKPRDIMWRLTLAQKQFPNETRFTQDVLHQTEIEYSSKLWDEIKYELSVKYSSKHIEVIEMILSGGSVIFDLGAMEAKFFEAESYSANARALNEERSVREILGDLYRLGAVGNFCRSGPSGTDTKHRWAFRGDVGLLWDKQMTLHPGLLKRLSAVPRRARGSSTAHRRQKIREEE